MIYQYRCFSCSHVTEAYRRVADRDDLPSCEECGGTTRKIISLPKVHGDFEPYYDEHLQTHIQGKQHRKRVMAEQGVQEHFGQGWHTSAKKSRKVG